VKERIMHRQGIILMFNTLLGNQVVILKKIPELPVTILCMYSIDSVIVCDY